MFPRHKRVTRSDFPTLLRSRRRVSTIHFSATLSDSVTAPAGYAVVVAKKVEATSVGRHALKRRILGVLEQLEATLPSPGIIIFAKSGAGEMDRKALSDELSELLRQPKGA